MKRLHAIPATIVLLLLSIAYFSCRKSIPLDDSDQAFPLQLDYNIQNDSIVLNWNGKAVTSFQRSIVLRSSQPIPTGIVPQTTTQSQIAFTSNDNAVTRAADFVPVFQDKVYYKVYVQLDGRFIESNQIEVSFGGFSGEGRPEIVLFHPDSNWVVTILYSNNNLPHLTVIDYATMKVLKQISMPDVFDANTVGMAFKRYQGQENLLMATNGQRFLRIQLPNLTILEEKSLPFQTWSVLASPTSDFLFFTHYDYYSAVAVRKLSDITVAFKSFERPNSYYNPRKLAFLNPDNLAAVEVSYYEMNRFSINTTTGNLVGSYNKTIPLQGYTPFPVDMPMSADRQYFIPNLSGQVFNPNLELVGTVPLNPQVSSIDFRFSPDGKFIYVLEQFFTNTAVTNVRKIAFPEMTEVAKTTYNDVVAKRIAYGKDNVLRLFCTNVFDPIRYTILPVNL